VLFQRRQKVIVKLFISMLFVRLLCISVVLAAISIECILTDV